MRTRFLIWALTGVLGLLFTTLSVVNAFPPNSSPWLSRPGTSDNTEAMEYYTTTGAPSTLNLWKSTYGFNGSNDTAAIYYNAGDLGFGREMHCRKNGADVACYVVNHGLGPAGPIQPSIAAAIANQNNLPTVAMVYHNAQNGNPNDVTFYIYDPAGNRLTGVGLDSEGDKFVPNMCLACHGGAYNSTSNTTSGANFLPFDTESFRYSPQPGYTLTDQQEAFRQLNALVRDTNPTTSITELIDGWYAATGGVGTPGSTPDNNFVPVGYTGSLTNTNLYNNVFKPNCRTCHMARTGYYSFADPANLLASAEFPVFQSFEMPHAELTNHNFWNSPAPAQLANTGDWSYRVTRLDDPTPDGCNPGDCSLREAILAVNAGSKSIITFDVDGVFTLTRSGYDDDALLGDLDITAEVILLGNGPEQTIIDGGGIDRVFHVHLLSGTGAVIQNVTIQNGQVSNWGGGIYNEGGPLTLNNSVVKDNVAIADANTYMSTDVPKTISAAGTPVVASTLTITSGGVIADVNVVNLNGTHTYINDLSFTLQSPLGTQVTIMAQSCGSEANFNINLDDEAAPGAWPCPPTDGGPYQPSNPLSAFDGEGSTGTWTLIVNDHANLDGGSLDGWGLEIVRRYMSTDVPRPIPLSVGVIASTLTIADGGVIQDLNVVNLNGTHTWINDLSFTLQSPQGNQVQFMAQSCSSEDNFNINFDDEAASANWPCPPTDGGTYIPSNSLSAFDGEDSTGTWTLIVQDSFPSADGGSLNGWGLEIAMVAGKGDGAGIASRNNAITEINSSTLGPDNVSSNQGGGLYNAGSAFTTLNNSTVSGNSAGIGGGLYNAGVVTTTLNHSTLTGNEASNTGGGVSNADSAILFVRNTLIAGNTGGGLRDCFNSATYSPQGYNLFGQNGNANGCPTTDGTSLILAGAITTALDQNLSLAPGRTPYHALVLSGPALDAIPLGGNCSLPSYDQLNLARPQDGDVNTTMACDIGAYEAPAIEIPISGLTAANNSPTALGNPTTLTASVVAGTYVTYQWNFGDLSPISSLQSPTHTYATLGTYTAIVTATNSLSTVSASTVVTIQQTISTAVLTVTPAGAGTGTVTSAPSGISCPADCSESYVLGTVVTLTAVANVGSTFTGWSGACSGVGACAVTLDLARNVTATFATSVIDYKLYLPLIRR